MKRSYQSTLIGIALAIGALSLRAEAADLPGRRAPAMTNYGAAVNWTGFYAGGHFGYGFGSARSADIDGFAIGGQLGYNHQIDRAVFGIEGDLSYSGIDYRGFTDSFRQKWLMSGRARVGYSFDRFLPYVTGGVAYSTSTMKGFGGKDNQGHMGFVIGIGGEMMLTSNISARLEFLHTRYGSESYVMPLATRRVDVHTNVLRLGVNYKF